MKIRLTTALTTVFWRRHQKSSFMQQLPNLLQWAEEIQVNSEYVPTVTQSIFSSSVQAKVLELRSFLPRSGVLLTLGHIFWHVTSIYISGGRFCLSKHEIKIKQLTALPFTYKARTDNTNTVITNVGTHDKAVRERVDGPECWSSIRLVYSNSTWLSRS